MILETRIVRQNERRINIREVEAIHDSDRDDAFREFFSDDVGYTFNSSDLDFLSLRGGLLG